jgi:hypothetical protein
MSFEDVLIELLNSVQLHCAQSASINYTTAATNIDRISVSHISLDGFTVVAVLAARMMKV